MSDPASEIDSGLVARAIDRALAAGAAQADALLIRADSREVKVRGDEIEFVKQASEHCLGLRALVQHKNGRSTALTSTSDLSAEAIQEIADDTVALARASFGARRTRLRCPAGRLPIVGTSTTG